MSLQKLKNIVISGTNFWNPGDDFVRDGVIRVLKELFKGYKLNFLFYNFNADFFPQSKFEGIGNIIAAGDLDKYREFVDAVVIAGLSAGNEIKDLYNWIIINGLENKVYLIGAGYENDYVDKHIYEEPEATIFKNARVITGRTKKTPAFIPRLGLPYYHINCPAILSVENVKDVPVDRKIERIGFSIQIPHEMGIVNQATGDVMFQLATSILLNLSSKYTVEVVAHHKTEYFHFLHLLKNHDIPVIFSSFYQDLFDIYQRYDLVISTRLHACIFANGFGIPAFIINETTRHTHTAEGFPHSICINNMIKFNEEFEKICMRNLRQIAQEAKEFKNKLMQKYLNVLAEPFGVDTASLGSQSKAIKQKQSQANCCLGAEDSKSTNHVPADYQFDSEINEQKLVRNIVKEGMIVIDVGAHLGKYTKLFSLLTGDKGRVYAFEPAESSFKKLASSLNELNCTNVTLINKAIYSQNDKVLLHEFPEEFSAWNSLGWPKMENPEEPTRLVPIEKSSEVDAMTLDSFCQNHNINKIDYLKLDIEGAELEALIGASNLLENKAICYLQFEISEKMLQGLNTKAKFIFDFLKSKGYECHTINEDGEIGEVALDSDSFYENYIVFPSRIAADEITSKLFHSVCNDTNAKRRVLNTISQLTKDHWLERNIEMFKVAVDSNASWFETLSFLNWYATNLKPSNYLEVGVRRGRSLAQVLVQSPETKAYGFDTWTPEYAGVPNPGPDFVVSELKKLGVKNLPILIAGNSHETLPRFWFDPYNPRQFELILVDGDHSYKGAKLDLDIAFDHLAPGGALVFDDINHNAHPELRGLWNEYKTKFPDNIFIEHSQGCGVGVTFKPPFTKLKMYLDINKQEVKDNKPNVDELAQKKVETFDQTASSLPIHFFTIVLNGQPFIRHHIEVFKQLPFKWHWHIIEGVAELKHDTAWSVKLGGRINEQLHRNGLSNDGTTEYIGELAKQFPDNITIYRKPNGAFWNGKLEMVNTPLTNINEECLLWQVDSDELWTAEQIRTSREMFKAEPDRTAAYYLDHFFVGENLVTTTINTYGNNTSYEWLRTWRFNPCLRWMAHEPPRLCRPAQDGKWVDIATIKPFKHHETMAKKLVFQHYAYAIEKQLAFKEIYYGYKNAVEQWQHLQQHKDFPVFLRDYFAWVKDGAQVNTIWSQNIKPIAWKDSNGQWQFSSTKTFSEQQPQQSLSLYKKVLIVRTDSIGDFVIFSGTLPYYRKLYPNSHITIIVRECSTELAEACPYINEVIVNHRKSMVHDQNYAAEFINRIRDAKFDIAICPIYSRDNVSDFITMNSGASERIVSAGNDSNMSLEQISNNNPHFTKLVPARAGTMPEIERNKEFLEALGVAIDQPYETTLWIEQEHKDFADRLLRELNIEKPIVVGPFAQYSFKNWTLQKWAKLISNYKNYPILICGSDKDTQEAENLISLTNHENIHNLCGKTTLRQLAAVFAKSELYLGVDSGPAHIAATVNCSQVIIMGGGHFGRFMPYSSKTSLVYNQMDCYGCNWRCKYGQDTRCIKDITVDMVEQAVSALLKRTVGPSSQNLKSDSKQAEKKQYLVSAIISTYNSEKFVRSCLEDLENQTIADKLEIIVVNSGSQQNEESIVKEFQQKYDNIKYIKTEKRETIYAAWNRAIKAASGKYITNANTDDRHYRNAFEILAKTLDENPNKVLVYANQVEMNDIDGQRVSASERINGEFSRSRLFDGQCFPSSQPMWRKDMHDLFGYFDESFTIGGDYEFWFRLTQKFDFLYLNEILGERFIGTDAVSQANGDLLSWENEMVIRKCYKYALQEGMTIGSTGISEYPVFSTWPEVNILKRNTKANLEGRQVSLIDNIKESWDFRTNPSPKLTIVIVTYNRQKELLENLYALNEQYEKEFQVIVVDNGGDLSWLKQRIDEFNFGICGIELKFNFGPSPARNIGTEFAKAEYIAFLDDDAVADKHLVSNTLEHFENYQICGLRGKVLPKSQNNSNNIPINYDLGEQIITTACEVSSFSAFRKDILVKMGGFDELLFGAEGMELSYRICKSQKEKVQSILYFPDVIVYHDHRSEGPAKTEKILRQHWMELLAWRKDNDIKDYTEFVYSLYPRFEDVVKSRYNDYAWILNVAMYLRKNFPEEAVKWAEKAVTLEPETIMGRYVLGSLYAGFGRYDEALVLLEKIYEPLRNSTASSDSEFISSEFESQAEISQCYLSLCTQLARCYMQNNQYEKIKQIYRNLLNTSDLTIPQEQRKSILNVLTKLDTAQFSQADAKKKDSTFAPAKSKQDYLVSAIVSTYNSQKFLRGCLEDLEHQTIAEKLQIIVINSGSQENEEAIVREYQQRHNNIIYIKTEQREGIYTAWNRAVKVARGRFLTNANTDDRHREDALEIMAETLLANPDIALVYGDQICTDTPNGTFARHHAIEMARRPEYSRERLLFGCCVGSQPMWCKSLHDEFGYFDDTLACAGDWDFWLRISSKYKFKHIPEFLGLYYYNENGIEHGRKIHSLYERYIVGRRYGNPYISVIPLYKSKDNPLVSVIMPAYNAAEYIAEAVESVLIQNYRNFELIIVDDGSTDDTKKIVESFKDDKIKYFYKNNGGPSSARNLAISKAKGQYIMPLDSDDMMTPDFIAKHLKEFEQHPEADLIYCDDSLIGENARSIRIIKRPEYSNRKSLIKDMFRCGFPIVPFRTCIRRSVFDKICLFDEDLLVGEDYDMIRRFVKVGLKAHHLSEPLYIRRIHADSLSRKYSAQKATCHFDVVRRFTETFAYDELFPDVEWDQIAPEMRQLHAKCLAAGIYLAIGQDYIKTNVTGYARKAFDQACSELNDCVKMAPENQSLRQLLQKIELIRAGYSETTQQAVS